MTAITCPACGSLVGERTNATTVRIAHGGRTTLIAGGAATTTCGKSVLRGNYRLRCGTTVPLLPLPENVIE